ncbi:hypothetical protein JK358_18655 [Nocardia sp. 2]|uniref:Asp23/Gls24 family envelope stress response protein n=1 Tax=Nocardia acididurans TaxID=2802282 RepID=A0ABS1M705_9NOCA|nr:hypothetical protein [Nocardia acididurans]MBL1076422.1 hypothetical protein [Nocardia acididurans]
MTAKAEVIDSIVSAIEEVEGLHPATGFGLDAVPWLPRGGKSYAVDLTPALVEIRVAASELPIPPLLEKLGGAVRALLQETAWATATVRLVVEELYDDTESRRKS